MRKPAIALIALLLAACNDDNPAPPAPPSYSYWTFVYSSNVSGACDDFDFPQQDGAHYCVKALHASLGQSITMSFTITGDGTLVPPGDSPPGTTRLFLWRRGDNMTGAGQYQQYRYWSTSTNLSPGSHTVTISLSPENWTDVYGQSGSANPGAFSAALSDLQGIGYTFGGRDFAGHGDYAQGVVHFHLDQYMVQ